VLTFFVSLFVLLMQFLWKYVDDFVGKGFEWYTIAELMFFASATFVPMALPLAVLLSSLMTFGNLGENYELVAIKSSGISLQKILKPLIVFIIIVSIGAFYFSNNILPKANLKFLTLLRDVRHKKPAVQIKEGVFYNEISDYVIRIAKKDPDGISIINIS
jgi:lipopolysaccharide export system permease protein